jgi:hypothetical protein
MGKELFDANRAKIGTVIGLGFPRRKFGSWWILVEAPMGKRLIVPADPISASGERLVLPYAKGYVESGPAVEDNQPLSQADERRLALHYGIAGTGCRQGCGLCMAARRAARRHSSTEERDITE